METIIIIVIIVLVIFGGKKGTDEIRHHSAVGDARGWEQGKAAIEEFNRHRLERHDRDQRERIDDHWNPRIRAAERRRDRYREGTTARSGHKWQRANEDLDALRRGRDDHHRRVHGRWHRHDS